VFAQYSPGVDWRAAHSIYFEVLGEQGFIGLAIFLGIGIAAYRSGTWVQRNVREHSEFRWAGELARMLQVSIAGYAAGGAFLSLGYFDLYYGLVAIMILTRVAVGQFLTQSNRSGTEAPSSRGLATKGHLAQLGLARSRPAIAPADPSHSRGTRNAATPPAAGGVG
jgi:hypothetical protein